MADSGPTRRGYRRERSRRRRTAITAVRYQGIVHDFVGLNPLRGTRAAQAAITQGIEFLSGVLGTA